MKIRAKVAGCLGLAWLLVVSGCVESGSKVTAVLNESASLTGTLPFNPLQWKVITTAVNKQDSSMYTLYGNDVAVQYARTHAEHAYPNGAVLSLVTWVERDDSRWFGGKIPDHPRSVEFVTAGQGSYTYQAYAGTPLAKVPALEGLAPNERTLYLLSQRAAVLP